MDASELLVLSPYLTDHTWADTVKDEWDHLQSGQHAALQGSGDAKKS